jgi:26S proteasome regulatory subunit T4
MRAFGRFSEGTSADREIQRTLMELLNQMDGFDVLGQVGFGLLYF